VTVLQALSVHIWYVGELTKHRTHPGKNVFTGAVGIVDNVIMCAGYDVDQGVAYINSMILCGVCMCVCVVQYST